MVKTRSQTIRNNQIEPNEMDRQSDSENECSIPEVFTREQITEFNDEDVLNYQNHSGRDFVIQRFSEMNGLINELTNLVLALTEKISSSNGEGNELNTVSNSHEARSDMVTGVQTNNTQTNPMGPSTSHYPQSSAHQIDDIVIEIHHLRDTMTDTVQHPKILQTQVPLFRGNKEKYNEFEHFLLNHLRPHRHKLSEEQKLTYFQSLLCDDAIEFWQSLKITTQKPWHKSCVTSKKDTQKKT